MNSNVFRLQHDYYWLSLVKLAVRLQRKGLERFEKCKAWLGKEQQQQKKQILVWCTGFLLRRWIQTLLVKVVRGSEGISEIFKVTPPITGLKAQNSKFVSGSRPNPKGILSVFAAQGHLGIPSPDFRRSSTLCLLPCFKCIQAWLISVTDLGGICAVLMLQECEKKELWGQSNFHKISKESLRGQAEICCRGRGDRVELQLGPQKIELSVCSASLGKV